VPFRPGFQALTLVAAFIGITSSLSRSTNIRQRAWIEKVQGRLKVTTEILGNMKAVKMLGLSSTVSNLLQDLRRDEISSSSSYRKVLLSVVVICKSSSMEITKYRSDSCSWSTIPPCPHCHVWTVCCNFSSLGRIVAQCPASVQLADFDHPFHDACHGLHTDASQGHTSSWLLQPCSRVLQLWSQCLGQRAKH
jgi:hypothetical protein